MQHLKTLLSHKKGGSMNDSTGLKDLILGTRCCLLLLNDYKIYPPCLLISSHVCASHVLLGCAFSFSDFSTLSFNSLASLVASLLASLLSFR